MCVCIAPPLGGRPSCLSRKGVSDGRHTHATPCLIPHSTNCCVFGVEKWVYTVQTSPEGRSTSSSFLFLPLDFSDHGDFSATTELPEGRHEYKFIVDGQWRHDPYAVSMSIHDP